MGERPSAARHFLLDRFIRKVPETQKSVEFHSNYFGIHSDILEFNTNRIETILRLSGKKGYFSVDSSSRLPEKEKQADFFLRYEKSGAITIFINDRKIKGKADKENKDSKEAHSYFLNEFDNVLRAALTDCISNNGFISGVKGGLLLNIITKRLVEERKTQI